MINEAASRGAEEAVRKLQTEPGSSVDVQGTVAYWGMANELVKQRRAVSAFDKYKNAPANLKRGKVCTPCELGSTCRYHHPASNRVCFKFQTEDGCPNKACTYTHEVIGKEATQSLSNWVSQKGKEKKEKAKGGGKGKTPQKEKPCKHWHSPKTPGQCSWGDGCKYMHGALEGGSGG